MLQDRPNALTILVGGAEENTSVKVSFFGGDTADDTMVVASLLDLMATKLKVMLQRIEAKDYRDIAAMLMAGLALDHGLAAARALYGPAFQPNESLKALVFFEGGNLATLTAKEKETLITAAAAVRDLPEISRVSLILSAAK